MSKVIYNTLPAWKKQLIDNPSRYIQSMFEPDEWFDVVAYELEEPEYTPPWNKGLKGVYKTSEETKEKLRQINLGKKHTEEAKAKIRKATTGVRQSEETRAKKRKPYVKPKDFADKIRETRKSTTNFRQGVIAYNIKYKSIRAAARAVGYSHTNVRAFCLDENNRDFRFDTCK